MAEVLSRALRRSRVVVTTGRSPAALPDRVTIMALDWLRKKL
jgi:hypothetical protein